MFIGIIIGVVVLFAMLYWLFFIKPAQDMARKKANVRAMATTRTLVHSQTRALKEEPQLTDVGYGELLRQARGDRQRVETWIIEVQRNIPGCSRQEAIDRLARKPAPAVATPG